MSAIRVDRKLKSTDVIDLLSDQFILRGVPEHIRSDNGPEFVARSVQDWIGAVGAKTAYFERGSIPGRTASSKASTPGFARDQLLDGEIFYFLPRPGSSSRAGGATTNTERPHGSLGYKPGSVSVQ